MFNEELLLADENVLHLVKERLMAEFDKKEFCVLTEQDLEVLTEAEIDQIVEKFQE